MEESSKEFSIEELKYWEEEEALINSIYEHQTGNSNFETHLQDCFDQA